MSIRQFYKRIFLSKYENTDAFTYAVANFLVIICLVFFTVMFILFFLNLSSTGLIKSLISSGISCLTAGITILLVFRGNVWASGTFMTLVQALVLFLAGLSRTPETTLVTSFFFGFPTILLAVIYTRKWMHVIIMFYIIILMGLNIARFEQSSAVQITEAARQLFIRGSITGIACFIMTYILAYITMRSLRLALRISQDESAKNAEKTSVITSIMDMIKKSYQELTASIEKTDRAITNISRNIQEEASTIEEVVASIEEISSSTSGIEQTTKAQSSSVGELSTSITQLSGLIDTLQILGNDLQNEFEVISKMAETGNESSRSLDKVNRKTLENSNNIQTITTIIDEFFDKINLLSLNASIEAARAGEHGRGFAVVADEIGKLADSSSSELNKIKSLVDTNKSDVELSNSIISSIILFIESINKSMAMTRAKAIETLAVISEQKKLQGTMLKGTETVHDNSDFIKTSSSEQTIAIQEIAKSIENTNSLVQANNANAQVLTDNYEDLKTLAMNLKTIMFSE